MSPARTYPRWRDDVRLLIVDPGAGSLRESRTRALPELLGRGDVLVVNDAATLPAALRGHDDRGNAVEMRLLAVANDKERADAQFWAVLFGAGDWHVRTEDRPPPPMLVAGARLQLGALTATIVHVDERSPRLVAVRFHVDGDALWAALYREARPVQYSHLAHDLPLWAVQTVFAERPWAFEMPSAGRPLSWEILLALKRKGVRWARLTHAAGLSATGDAALDAALPLRERFDIPAATVETVADAGRRQGRVFAVGTTVVRALEGAMATGGLRPGPGSTDLRIGSDFNPAVVDGVLSGIHGEGESHFSLLAAFAGPGLLAEALRYAERHGFTTHELGDAMWIGPDPRARREESRAS